MKRNLHAPPICSHNTALFGRLVDVGISTQRPTPCHVTIHRHQVLGEGGIAEILTPKQKFTHTNTAMATTTATAIPTYRDQRGANEAITRPTPKQDDCRYLPHHRPTNGERPLPAHLLEGLISSATLRDVHRDNEWRVLGGGGPRTDDNKNTAQTWSMARV